MININQWNEAFSYLYWGSKNSAAEKDAFQNKMHELLFLKYKITLNEKLSIFLVDMFLNGKTYKEALGSFALVIMMMARLEQNHEDLNDLFECFIRTLSQETFDFYIKTNFVEILQTFNNKSFYNALKNSLAYYETSVKLSENAKIFTFFPITFFEEKFCEREHPNKPQNVFFSYNYKYEKKATNIYFNPNSYDIFSFINIQKQETQIQIPFISENSPHKHAINFLINKNYKALFNSFSSDLERILDETPRVMKDREEENAFELITTYEKEKYEFNDIFHKKMKENGGDFSKNSQVMHAVYEFIKPNRKPMSDLIEKTAFDRRLDRFGIRANDELKKFAEARENWAYDVLEEDQIKKGVVKKGIHIVRKWGRLQLIKIGDNKNTVPLNIPIQEFAKNKLTIYNKVRKREEFKKLKKLQEKEREKMAKGFSKKTSEVRKKRKPTNLKTKDERSKRKIYLKKKITKETGNQMNLKVNKKILEEKPKAGFGTMKENTNLDEDYDIEIHSKNVMESGFKVYLQKLKEIEEGKKKQDIIDNDEMDEKSGITKQEIERMKKSLFKEDSLYRKAFGKEESVFMKPQTAKEKEMEKVKQRENEEAGVQPKDKKELSKFDTLPFKKSWRRDKEKAENKKPDLALAPLLASVPYANYWNEKFEEIEYEDKEIVRKVEANLEQNQSKKADLLISLAYTTKIGIGKIEGVRVIEALMRKKDVSLAPTDKLKITFMSQMGEISKDYNNYLKATALDHSLPEQVYIKLLTFNAIESHYSRKDFKMILTHLIRYNTEISHSVIMACLEVFKSQKVGLTMLEFIHLILANKIKIPKESLAALLDHLKDYKVISDDIESVCLAFLKEYDWEFQMSFIESYLEMIIKNKKHDIYMMIFEKIKNFLLNRKAVLPTTEKHNENDKKVEKSEGIELKTEEKPTLEEQSTEKTKKSHKKKENKEVHAFYTDFMEKLNKFEVFKYSKLVFYDFVNNKYHLNQKDYLVGLKTFQNSPEEFLVLYKQYKESAVYEFNENLFYVINDAISQNPKDLGVVFDELLDEYIYPRNYILTTNNLNYLLSVFGRTQKFFEFTNFLRFLDKNEHELNRNTKLTCYKVLGRVSDDMSKPYIKGLIDSLFE